MTDWIERLLRGVETYLLRQGLRAGIATSSNGVCMTAHLLRLTVGTREPWPHPCALAARGDITEASLLGTVAAWS